MKLKNLFLILLVLFLSSCAKNNKIILGEAQSTFIPAINSSLNARIDTGATTTSINALNIKELQKDGKTYISFDLQDSNKKLHNKILPLSRIAYIKRHGASKQKRYVVKLELVIEGVSKTVDVSLANRSKFEYPVLIGRNYLKETFLVDVSK